MPSPTGSDMMLRGLVQGNVLRSLSAAGALCASPFSLTLLIIAFEYLLYILAKSTTVVNTGP